MMSARYAACERCDVADRSVCEHGGRVVQTGGDSLLAAFDRIDGAG
jgi:class 3 adenylate cyclase